MVGWDGSIKGQIQYSIMPANKSHAPDPFCKFSWQGWRILIIQHSYNFQYQLSFMPSSMKVRHCGLIHGVIWVLLWSCLGRKVICGRPLQPFLLKKKKRKKRNNAIRPILHAYTKTKFPSKMQLLFCFVFFLFFIQIL